MATLGQAYVQIMPSSKGISGSIEKMISPEASAAGKSAGGKIASSMASAMGNAGGKLTKAITLPVVGAVSAVVGLVGALGFKRLVGLDTAKSKLKGLGYDALEVERISGQVENAIKDGMTTMGEGVSIAAGGLAAGVKEGKDLEKYIGLVGDAAVGANRPVDEMAQIFNRVQGGGRLMTQELNMIEMGLPGFAQAMADEVAGGSLESFRDMVTNGEVGSDEFLNVMDDFAGGMAGAYSESMAGMAKNTLAYVGIIGEALLEGLFEDGKKGLANFIEVLKSEEVQEWATQTGEKIREVVNKIIGVIKTVFDWWTGLSDGAKTFIGVIAGIAVAIGPILLIASKITTTVMSLMPLFKALGVVIGVLTSPIGLVVASIVAAAALIFIYWGPIKEFFLNMWESIKEIGLSIWGPLKEAWITTVEFLKDLWEPIGEFFSAMWESITEMFMLVWEPIKEAWNEVVEFLIEIWEPVSEFFVEMWEEVKEIFTTAWELITVVFETAWSIIKPLVETGMEAIQTVIQTVMGIIQPIFNAAWNAMQTIVESVMNVISFVVSTVWNVIKAVITTVLDVIMTVIRTAFNIVKTIIQTVLSVVKALVSGDFNQIRGVITTVINAIRSIISSVFNAIRSIISSVMSGIRSVISSVWNGIRNTVSSVVNGIRSVVSNIFNSLRGIVTGAFSRVTSAVKNGMTNTFNTVTGFFSKFLDAGKNIVGSIADGIKAAISKVTDAIGGVVDKVRSFLPFSPAKEGPLKDLDKLNFGGTISMGIDDGANEVEKAMQKMLDFDLTKKANFNDASFNRHEELLREQKQPIILQVDGKTFAQIMGDYTSQEGGNRIRRMERGLA